MFFVRGPLPGGDGEGWYRPRFPQVLGWVVGVGASYLIAVIFCLIYALMAATPAKPQELRSYPLEKRGICPSQYRSSSSYCEPMDRAPICIPKVGICPSNMIQSGGYCCQISYDRFRYGR
jgi:hypothetical protein